jgi:tetratricopeptide (TPR) repeat protein
LRGEGTRGLKRIWLFLGLILVAVGVAAGIYWRSGQTLSRRLAEVRAHLGTREARTALASLVVDHPGSAEAAFWQARQLRLDGSHEPALAALKRAVELGWPQDQIDRERLLLQANADFLRTEPALEQLLDRHPEDRDVLLALALGWTRQRNLHRAELLVDAVLQRDQSDGAALAIRGKILLRKGRAQEARPLLEQAVSQGQGQYYYQDARILLADCLLELGRFADALLLFRACQADDPDDANVLFGIGRCHWYLNEWDEAARAFEAVLRLRPDDVDALSQLAYIHEERSDWRPALELLERAARLDPKWADVHFRMAKILRVLGENERAAEHEKRAQEVKKYWARPRPSSPGTLDAYTGEEVTPLRNRPAP